MHFCKPVPKAIYMVLWTIMGFLEKFVTNIQNGVFVQASCVIRTDSICFVCLAVCILFIVIWTDFDATASTGNAVSAGIVMSLAHGIVACSFCSNIGALRKNFVVTSTSVHLPSLQPSAECSGLILFGIINILRMNLSIYVIPNETFTAMFWKIPK